MKRIIALLNLSLLFYYPLYSQDENSYIDELSNISPEAIKIVDEYSATSFDQDTGAVIIFRESKVVVRDNKIDTITYHIIGKILDERARDDYSQIPIAFNSYYEDMKLDFARSINEDKTFINILEDAIQFKTPPEYMGSNTYTDTKILAFSIPALTINKYFEYQISITTKKPVVENHWFNTFYFNHRLRKLSDPYFIRIDPVKTSRFIVNVKRGNNFRFEISKAELEETKVVNEEFESYTWVMNNLKPIVFEAYMPYLFENLPSITVSSIENWNEFAEWAYSTLGTRVKVTNDILSKAVELTSDSKSKIESIKKIYDYVRSEIDYIQADLDRGGLTPHYSDEILRTKYGDCKDQVILMLSMLEAVGIDGYPALLSSYSFRNHQNYLPTQYFDHLIVYIPTDSNDIWLDATTDFTEFPELNWANQNRLAFVFSKNDSKFIKTPTSTAQDNNGIFNLSIQPENDSIISSFVLKTSGALKDNVYSLLNSYSDSEQKTMISDLIDYYYIENLKLEAVQINETINQVYKQIFTTKHVNSISELHEFIFASNMPFAVFYFMINIPYLENRKYDYKLPFIFSLKGREVYHSLWKDVSIRNVPESDSVISKYFEFHQYFNEFEDSVEVDWDFTFNKDLIKAEDFALFIEEFEKWDKLLSYEISFKKRTDSLHQSVSANSKDKVDKTFNSLNDSNNVYIVPTIVHSANVDSETIEKIKTVLVENVEAVNDKDIDRAMNTVHKESPVIERSLKTFEEIINNENISVKFFIEDVKVIDVVNGCAIASNTLISNVNYMSNEASFRSQVINVLMKIDDGWKIYQTYHQVDITSCNLYDELGWFYYKKDKYATAIIFYELAAANDSNCDHVYGNLGWNYYLTGDYNKCIENSEKAVQKDSTALYAHYNIALAYLCNGEVEKAKSLYTDVVEFNHTLGRDINEGAIIDLKDLIDKDFMKDEAETILKEIFKVKDIKNPIETNNFGSGSPATKVSD